MDTKEHYSIQDIVLFMRLYVDW